MVCCSCSSISNLLVSVVGSQPMLQQPDNDMFCMGGLPSRHGNRMVNKHLQCCAALVSLTQAAAENVALFC
jgi:hypothetical protein